MTETIKPTPNYSKRTFTIRKSNGSKYRTTQMTIDEFEECEYHTSADWANFLQNGSYYIA
tara:strand:- start:463 stop:642 length:180 start_codon:yes stop_codon:yes gene_type:complete